MVSRAERNFNPGNIRPGRDKWQGQTGIDKSNDNTGVGYVQFADWAYGLRAFGMTLRNYQRRHKKNNIEEIINRWAPANTKETKRNHTDVYINRVVNETPFTKNEHLNMEDWYTVAQLIRAMSRVEIGISPGGKLPFTEAQLRQGLELAGFTDVPQDGVVKTAPTHEPAGATEKTGLITVVGATALGAAAEALQPLNDGSNIFYWVAAGLTVASVGIITYIRVFRK